MMKAIRNSSKLVMLAFILMMAITGCKSKKKQMEAAAAEKARLEQEQANQRKLEEEKRRKEAEEKAAREAQQKALEAQANAPKARLTQYFESIANAATIGSANTSINEALAMFASPQTPVLIVVSESGGQKDYDRPTTIVDYLNYLKDQKKNPNKISNVQVDSSGKITELELRK